MEIRTLTSEDKEWVADLANLAYSAPLKDEDFEKAFKENYTLVLGDPAIPAYIRIIHYNIDPHTATFLPEGIKEGFNTQIADLHVPDDATLIKLLATGLGEMLKKYPEIANQPVWAALDNETVAAIQQKYFPKAWVDGLYIGHDTLQGAYDEVKQYG